MKMKSDSIRDMLVPAFTFYYRPHDRLYTMTVGQVLDMLDNPWLSLMPQYTFGNGDPDAKMPVNTEYDST